MAKRYFTCHSCSKRVEIFPDERPCEAISGWIAVAQWKGVEAVEHYNFCSFTCLKRWVDAQVPKIPKVYLEAFKDEEL